MEFRAKLFLSIILYLILSDSTITCIEPGRTTQGSLKNMKLRLNRLGQDITNANVNLNINGNDKNGTVLYRRSYSTSNNKENRRRQNDYYDDDSDDGYVNVNINSNINI